jgi:hypothetical protein
MKTLVVENKKMKRLDLVDLWMNEHGDWFLIHHDPYRIETIRAWKRMGLTDKEICENCGHWVQYFPFTYAFVSSDAAMLALKKSKDLELHTAISWGRSYWVVYWKNAMGIQFAQTFRSHNAFVKKCDRLVDRGYNNLVSPNRPISKGQYNFAEFNSYKEANAYAKEMDQYSE